MTVNPQLKLAIQREFAAGLYEKLQLEWDAARGVYPGQADTVLRAHMRWLYTFGIRDAEQEV